MSIPILPQSQFNGDIFVSNFHDVHNLCKLPSVRLDSSHPFHQLWHSHLQSLTQTGSLFEGVIDCLAAILLGDPCWKETTTPTAVSQTRSDICTLLIRTPPNIIILSSLDDYACHIRHPTLWNFVCISNFYVTLWMETIKPRHKMGLAALLITSMDHEIAHWAQSIKNRLFYLSESSLSHISDLTTTFDLGPVLSDDDDDDAADTVNDTKIPSFHSDDNPYLADTPKASQAPWISGPIGEAGDFLEISTRGGIMEYDFRHQRVYLVVGEDDFQILTKSYLDLYERNEGPPTSLVFHPASWKSLSPSDAQVKFPFDGVDGCPPSRKSYGRNRHHVPTKILKL